MPEANRERPELIRFLARDQMAERVRQPAPRAEVTLVGGDVPVIRIYDVIDSWGGYWGVSSVEVAEALDLVPDGTPVVEVHLNSPGGEATEGVAIANLLRQHPSKVVAVVDGLAASAASMIAMGADEVVMAPSSQMMIHDASGGAWGTAAFLEKQARALHHLSDMYAAAYAGKAGGEPAAWRELMLAETWYSPEEAVTAGLADRVLAEAATDDPKASVAHHDLRVFAYAGREHAPAPELSPASAVEHAAAGGTTRKEPDTMSDTLIQGLRERLGFAENADEATVLASLDEALSENADPKPDPAAVVIPEGHVVVPEARLKDLETGVAASASIAQKIHEQERTAFLDSVRTKFAPANRAAWEAEYDRDPAGTKAHFEKAPDIVALTEVGHGEDPTGTDDAEFYALFPDEKKAV